MDVSNESTNEQVNHKNNNYDDVIKFGIEGYVTRNNTDDIIQALANALNATIDLHSINNEKALMYIDHIKQWLQIPSNGTVAMKENKYKILAKYLEIPISSKKWEKIN
jgi:copper(I)-binding protein